jgi:predicted deacetylase
MTWLEPVASALDRGADPTPVFFRDDDAGWADDRLVALIDRFARRAAPIDVAVIPAETTDSLAAALRDRAANDGVRLHQHGFAHVNHEPTGRKHEFGPSRDFEAQLADLLRGREIMAERFGALVDPIFTPPWNRCTADTGAAVVAAGFDVLSRDHTAAPLNRDDLREVPVTVDWFGQTKGVPWTRVEVAERIAAGVGAGGPVGIMLHHAVTDDANLVALDDLLALLCAHPAARLTTIATIASLQ